MGIDLFNASSIAARSLLENLRERPRKARGLTFDPGNLGVSEDRTEEEEKAYRSAIKRRMSME